MYTYGNQTLLKLQHFMVDVATCHLMVTFSYIFDARHLRPKSQTCYSFRIEIQSGQLSHVTPMATFYV